MIDVRLTATNPEDSTLVPVPCNSRGELLTVAPKIEVIPNDVDIEGDLYVAGTINGAVTPGEPGPPGPPGEPGGEGPPGEPGTPGEGVPLPYGPDGAYLQIVDGVPAWAAGPGPGPEPEPNVACANLWDKYTLFDESFNPISPPDPTEYLKESPGWTPHGSSSNRGAAKGYGEIAPGADEPDTFDMTDSFGKVLTVGYTMKFGARGNSGYKNPPPEVTATSSYAALVANTWTDFNQSTSTINWWSGTTSWLLNRELDSLGIKTQFSAFFWTDIYLYLRYFALEDAGTFALRRQLTLEEEIKRLRGMTTGIDLSRPTQD